MNKTIIFMMLLSVPTAWVKDMSFCLKKKYQSPQEEQKIKDSYVQFHLKHSIKQEKATADVLNKEAQQIVDMINL